MLGVPSSITDVQNLIKLSPRDMTATALENVKYFSVFKKGRKFHTFTYWIVGDLSCNKSRDVFLAALEHAVSTPCCLFAIFSVILGIRAQND